MDTHSFTDVPDGAVLHRCRRLGEGQRHDDRLPAGSDTFKPLDGVTRGENITFAKRYDLVVQLALGALTSSDQANAASIVALEAQVALLTNSVAAFVGGDLAVSILDDTDVVGKSISLAAPAEGILLVTATADVQATASA